MKKRVFSLLLALALLAGLLPGAAWAVEPEGTAAPASITVKYVGTQLTPKGELIGKEGDTFQFKAYDQDGHETPVTWTKSYTWVPGAIDADTGLYTAGYLSSGGSSALYITATSTLETNVKADGSFSLCGYQMSSYNKTPTVALAEDGQTAKTISTSGGYNGSTVWSYEGAEGIARLSEGQDLSKKPTSVKFDALRPGTFTASFKLDFDETMTDTATLTITGVAVEDPAGGTGKTYLTVTADQPNPTARLTAYAAPGRSIAQWSSANEAVATVDEDGLVTARGVGTALITAADSEGARGGIKVVVQSGETPYFENLQFLKSALSDWNDDTFSATRLEYPLTIRAYSTTKLTLQATTLYDSGKYTATAAYPGIDGKERQVEISSGKITYLEDIPFDAFNVTVTLADKQDGDNKTVYIFHATRPRDATQTIKSGGAVLQPDGRSLLASKYNGYAEGTMFQLNDDGSVKTGWGSNPATGISASQYLYKCYALDNLEKFSLNLTGATAYTHLRWSADGGETWAELPQGGGATGVISFPAKPADANASVQVLVNILDDKTYTENIKAGKDGFADSEGKTYTFTVEQAAASAASAQILTAVTAEGDWYPAFSPDAYTYTIILPAGGGMPELKYTAAEGAAVKLGSYNAVEQTPDENGVYTLALTSSAQTLTVTSADGSMANSYSFQAKARTAGAPDAVTDYLCINSQYTNGGNGSSPHSSLYGGMVSLGSFGGYITYYYEDGLRDDPANRYGVDFYVKGNANKDVSTPTKTSFFEPAQAWVSEDGETWYALAGSAHYDDGVVWDYTVTYTKTAGGRTAWTDSLGSSNDGSSRAGLWPSKAVYDLNGQAGKDTITLSGIALPARSGDLAVVGQAVDAYPTQWGYADCQVNGEENPYLDNSAYDLAASGFDLAWAVDAQGLPVDVSGMEFHYVKLQTASNIWHASFGEKSPEIAGVTRAEAQAAAVGKTAVPESVTVSDGAGSIKLSLTGDKRVYDLDVGDMKYVSVSVDGAAADDNIYINNQRIAADGKVSGIKVTKEMGGKPVRLLVQNGDREPAIVLLRLTSSATAADELIEGVKLSVSGASRTASTQDGETYTASVGYRIDEIGIVPIADGGVALTVNGEPLQSSYALAEGENVFTLTGELNGVTQTVTLRVTREAPPQVTGKVNVYFTLLGDEAHGDGGGVHTLTSGGLKPWIERSSYTVNAPATVLDVFEAAMGTEHTFVNADGNYISEIDGLAEFTNGPKSGWMYTLNGKYPDKGVAEQTVKNGDAIVFHYTDDYTAERASEKWNGPATAETDKKNVLPFVDVAEDAWYTEAVEFVFGRGLLVGTGADTFSPNANISRAMLAAVLYRLEGASAGGDNPFADVAAGMWYTDAAVWAGTNGIISGTEKGFEPDRAISRQELVTMLYRYAKSIGMDTTKTVELSRYTDGKSVAGWAGEAMGWAVANGILCGRSATTLVPAGTATRAEAAAILQRMVALMAG